MRALEGKKFAFLVCLFVCLFVTFAHQKEDSSALRPVAVPPLELGSLKTVASRGRRSKTVAGEAPHKNSFSGAGSPKRAVARKTRSSLTRSQQEEDARAVVENKRLVQSEQHEDGKIVGTVSDIATNTIEQQPQEEEEDTGQEQHQQQHQQQEQEQQEQQQQQQHDAEEQQQQQEQPQQHETQVQEQEVPTVREKEMLAEIASLKGMFSLCFVYICLWLNVVVVQRSWQMLTL
jgi:DNA mismatch repair ATPase MutL